MANDIQKLYDLPEISFIDDLTADTLLEEMISDFQEKYNELTGEYEVLGEFDKYRILLNAVALKNYQVCQYIDRAGKMNLLKYSSGDYLLNLGAARGVEMNEEKAATCPVTFTLSELQTSVVAIPQATQVTAGDGVYFETQEYAEIPPGTSEVTVNTICKVTGTVGNGYVIGQINVLVEPIPYIESVKNIAASSGGEDIMSDDDFREKIYLSPSGYSTTGPEDAYIYWVKKCSSFISDVKVITPEDDVVQIILLKKEGEIPDSSFLKDIQDYLQNNNIKPLTEKVIVTAPTVVNYDITGTYYINRSDAVNIERIQSAVLQAIQEYRLWQKEKIGRDLNPFYLQYLLMKSGVKRAELTNPTFTNINDTSIAIESKVALVYGGMEDD
ncbi:baseplate assembly protein [Anaerocolumna sp. MB42-C2]|uniref:baseplate assembly protein n=1 Tax=Anaerocolumna sp. MB42-C2 TaxID=3070997 RepID=UPI0027E07EE1|nr:baseplate J/gp47 family protein [Anaerocolumna sp. MB42-C2]WMJ88855.1 baseplate J/gp47 family protein [Anaerocolumna sp. MB42-C2]